MKGINLYAEDGPKISEGGALYNVALERLLFQGLNEVPGFLGVGSRLLEYFWEPATQRTASKIIEEIKYMVKTYEKRVTLKSVSVHIINQDTSDRGVQIDLEYEISGTEEVQEVTFNRIVEI